MSNKDMIVTKIYTAEAASNDRDSAKAMAHSKVPPGAVILESFQVGNCELGYKAIVRYTLS